MGQHKIVRSEDHKRRIAEAVKASWDEKRRTRYAQQRTGEGNPFFGQQHSDAVKATIKRKMLGEKNPFYGKIHSEETRKQQSEARKGRALGLIKYGISDEQLAAEKAAGNLWCHFHKGFVPLSSISRSVIPGPNSGVCKSCFFEYDRNKILKKYGLTHEGFVEKLASQGGGCAICGVLQDQDATLTRRHLHVDHDHVTGKTRGILCGKCNSAVARLDSIPDWPLKALAYLQKYK